jgi:hypothetical protein
MVVMPKPANPTTAGFPLGAVPDMFWPSFHFRKKSWTGSIYLFLIPLIPVGPPMSTRNAAIAIDFAAIGGEQPPFSAARFRVRPLSDMLEEKTI